MSSPAITRPAFEFISCQYSTKVDCQLVTIDHLIAEEHCIMSL
jgi:hypothetical protein